MNHEFVKGDHVQYIGHVLRPSQVGSDMRGEVTAVANDSVTVRFNNGFVYQPSAKNLMLVDQRVTATEVKQAHTLPVLPHDSAARKEIPLLRGFFDYFQSAIVRVAKHSYEGNQKHNPGEEIHWARGKSDDHLDAAMRHIMERDLVGAAWRILAALQLEEEAKGAPKAPGAK